MVKIEDQIMLAATLNLDINYEWMTNELMPLMSHAKCIPFSYPSNGITVTAYSLFLRLSQSETDYSYRGAKSADFNSWSWDYDLPAPYTRTVINSMPFNSLGTVRVVYFPSVPCVEHTDWDDPADTKHTLGLSLIPNTANTYCNVWCEKQNQYIPIFGNAMLLNDSIKHNVPAGDGTRITMRVFGDIDYSWFDNKIGQCFYL